MAFKGSKANLTEAQAQLDSGMSVREIAESQGVSRQAIYRLLKRGTLKRPSTAQDSPES